MTSISNHPTVTTELARLTGGGGEADPQDRDMSVDAPSVSSLPSVVAGDWRLWVDWCTATDHDPTALSVGDLVVFTADLPAAAAVADRRVRSIHRILTGAGCGLPRPSTTAPRWAHSDTERAVVDDVHGDRDSSSSAEWLTTAQALTALRREWYPEGVAARRDALILVLTAAGFTRHRIRTLRPAQVQTFPQLTIDTVPLGRHTDPALCPRCAAVRWLQVLTAYRHRSRYDVEDLLSHARTVTTCPRHDCLTLHLLEDGWHHTGWVTPAIDRWGAIQPAVPLSSRAVTTVLARRHRLSVMDPLEAADAGTSPGDLYAGLPTGEIPGTSRASDATGRRPSPEEQRIIGDLWGRAEHDLDELNDRISRLLDGLG